MESSESRPPNKDKENSSTFEILRFVTKVAQIVAKVGDRLLYYTGISYILLYNSLPNHKTNIVGKRHSVFVITCSKDIFGKYRIKEIKEHCLKSEVTVTSHQRLQYVTVKSQLPHIRGSNTRLKGRSYLTTEAPLCDRKVAVTSHQKLQYVTGRSQLPRIRGSNTRLEGRRFEVDATEDRRVYGLGSHQVCQGSNVLPMVWCGNLEMECADSVILSHGQMTRRAPELPNPCQSFHTTPTEERLATTFDL
ncbi:hypothetical protein AVEN_163945-1 [Araneus ventricosus]|uniref:Uncharacterized protein n=1 Tax=Araneus ventricosus TaxID=182803 RepID=A0A4Y2GZ58_ARAVE|nr:hypothetical protein AVEN_163945-1 [Araneus ventricosus]